MQQLLKVQTAIQNNNNSQLLKLIETNPKKYQTIKASYNRLHSKKRLSLLNEHTLLFLLLMAAAHTDYEYAKTLIQAHALESLTSRAAKLALGRLYSSAKFHKKTVEFYLPLFENDQLNAHANTQLSSADLHKLYTSLFEIALFKEVEAVLKFALKTYPTENLWGMAVLQYQINTQHLFKHKTEEIINNLNIMSQKVSSVEELQNMAHCYYTQGYYQHSFSIYEKLFTQITAQSFTNNTKHHFNAEDTLTSMHEITDIIKSQGKQSFLIAGTLLGLERDGRLFDHDKDADIGLFVEDYDEIYNLVKAICTQNSNFIAPDMYKKPPAAALWNVAIYDQARNSAVDLFFFHKKATHYETGIHTNCGIIKWQFAPFEIIETTLAGRQYLTPSNYQQGHLTEMYGDWQETVIVWESLINCPNLAPESQIPVIYYALQKLVAAIAEKSLKKFDNAYNNVTQRWHFQFTPQATANLKKVRTELERMESRSTL